MRTKFSGLRPASRPAMVCWANCLPQSEDRSPARGAHQRFGKKRGFSGERRARGGERRGGLQKVKPRHPVLPLRGTLLGPNYSTTAPPNIVGFALWVQPQSRTAPGGVQTGGV